MDFKVARALTITAALLLSASAQAATVTNWIWDDSGTLSAAANCQTASAADTHFRVLPGTAGASASNSGENRPAKLLTPTDVKSLAFTTVSGLKDITDSVLQLTSNLIPTLTIDSKKVSLSNSFWQVGVGDDESYVIMSCGSGKTKKDYVAFDVFVAGSATPIARIGVNASNAQILRNAIVLDPDQAEKIAAAADGSPVPGSSGPVKQIKKSNPSTRTSGPATSPTNKPTSTPAPRVSVTPSNGNGTSTTAKKTVRSDRPAAPVTSPTVPTNRSGDRTDDQGGETPSPTPGREVPVVDGGLQFVLCSTQAAIPVRNENLDRTLFSAKALEEVKLMQSFSPESPTKKVTSDKHTFIEVQFADRESGSNIGWIDQQNVRARSACPLKDPTPVVAKRPNGTGGGGLDNASCCEFPMRGRPTMSYLQGGRRFRAMRAAGRLHAACDLYRPAGESIVSISDGKVIRAKYYFYEGVFALEVLQDGGFVARYGEILGKNPTGISAGNRVTMGQTVGYVGTVDSGCCKPMLHFELYRGNANGPLTERSSSGFQRRSDLTDPSRYLQEWEKKKFGESY